MKLFDSHAHLDLKGATKASVDALLDRAWSEGLHGIVAIAGATNVGAYATTLSIADGDPRIYTAAGIHPHTGSQATPDALDKLRYALDHRKVVALGEIGLDYHYNHSTPAEQRKAFISQIRMAHEVELPIVVHTREADEDTIAIIRDEGADEIGGVIHCFSSGKTLADAALEMGFYLSFSGIVTFPKADEVQSVATQAPADRILAETDAPFLAPIPKRGRINEPAYVRYVVTKLAELRGMDPEEMAETIFENTRKCFRIE